MLRYNKNRVRWTGEFVSSWLFMIGQIYPSETAAGIGPGPVRDGGADSLKRMYENIFIFVSEKNGCGSCMNT